MSNFFKNLHPLISRSKNSDSDPNFAVLNALDEVLKEFEQDTINSKIHSFLHSATGKFLDEWGTWFSVTRRDNESDSSYRTRIVRYIDMPRGTIRSIQLSIRRYLMDPTVGVKVYETYNNIFFTNKSKLNGPDKLMGNYYRFAVIEVSVGTPFDEDLIDYLERFIPAGVKLYVNYDSSLPRTTDTEDTVATPILNITSRGQDSEGALVSGYDQYIGGKLLVSDSKELLDIFHTNSSLLNSTDVLLGAFNSTRENLHVFGKAQNFVPRLDTTMGEALLRIEEEEELELTSLDKIDNQRLVIPMNTASELYTIFNLDQYIYGKYYGKGFNIKRTRERYAELLENSAFTIQTRADISGATYDLQLYNFRTRNWVTLKREVSRLQDNKYSVFISNPKDYVSTNRILFSRIKANRTMNISFNYYSFEFKQQVDNIV